MSRLGMLLGSETRGNVVEALTLSEKPLTPYRLAKKYNMNVAKVYGEMKRLAGLGLVEVAGRKRGIEYRLADENLRKLALRLSSRVVAYEQWNGDRERASRFRMGLREVPRFFLGRAEERLSKRTRLPGELDGLAALGRKRFDAKYRRRAGREFARV